LLAFALLIHPSGRAQNPLALKLGVRMKNLFILSALVAAGAQAFATPTLYPTDPSSLYMISNPTSSGLLADDHDPRKVYVLPPNVAEASTGVAHSPTTHLGFCREMGNLQTITRDLSEQMKEASDQKVAAKKDVDKIFADLQTARKDAADFMAEKNLQAIKSLDDQIQALDDRLNDLYPRSNECSGDACDLINEDIRNTEKDRTDLRRDRRTLASQNANDVRLYDRKKAKVAALDLNYKEANSVFNQTIKDLNQIHADFMNMYLTYGKLDGMTVSFKYVSNWDANVASLRQANPAFQFEKIVTQNAKVFSSLLSVKDIPGNTAIIAYLTPGAPQKDYLTYGSGFPSAIQTEVLLSLVGACPIQHPEYFDIEQGAGADKMTYGLTIAYEFPATMQLKAEAKYNMYKMYQKIVSSGSSGGFFSSRSWSNVEERSYFRDSFNVAWTEQDPDNSVSEERRLEIEHEMRAHIMDRIANIALPMTPNRDGIIAANPPPEHGAAVVAGSLMKACPGNVYCVAGSLILTSLDAIFGSSSATASYMLTQDFEAKESWELNKVIMKPWVTSYVRK
jgi:hypothetical protein